VKLLKRDNSHLQEQPNNRDSLYRQRRSSSSFSHVCIVFFFHHLNIHHVHMSGSPWAKEWKSLASDNSQKAILLATFYKAFGPWPADIHQEAVQKLVAGRNPDDILQSRRLRTPRPQDDIGPATLPP
jgi:hypothetical protein